MMRGAVIELILAALCRGGQYFKVGRGFGVIYIPAYSSYAIPVVPRQAMDIYIHAKKKFWNFLVAWAEAEPKLGVLERFRCVDLWIYRRKLPPLVRALVRPGSGKEEDVVWEWLDDVMYTVAWSRGYVHKGG
ncbi:MAG: hypothetical protein ACK4SY_07060 [Pyrobaculum sp.]